MEIWKPVRGLEDTYEVSDLGRVRSMDRIVVSRRGVRRFFKGCVKKTFICNSGYPSVVLRKNGYIPNRNIHVLVMEAFVGPAPEGMEVCHNSPDKKDCRLGNLRYDTRGANNLDRERHGGGVRGENNPVSKLTEAQARMIREMHGVVPRKVLAKDLGVSLGQVSAIQQGRAWKHLALRAA